MLRIVHLFAALVLGASCLGAPPPERIAQLSRGINISHWLWLPRDSSEKGVAAYLPASEAVALRAAGFTHVRVPIDPLIFAGKDATSIPRDSGPGAMLLREIDKLTSAGLGVVIDVHPMGTRAEHMLADKAPDWAANLERFWCLFAMLLAETDPDRVFLELLNEPHGIKDKAEWPRVQERLVAAVRKICPRHTVILTGDDYGGIDGLLRLNPVKDPNVVYSFHFYESHTFTHQGATWGAPFWKFIKGGLPYPGTPENTEPVAAKIENEQAKGAVRWYGKEGWNKEKIAARVKLAVDWAKEQHVTLYCGEFGVIREETPRESRLAWLSDVTSACREHGIGCAMWDYAGGFGLVEVGKSRAIDQSTLKALGR